MKAVCVPPSYDLRDLAPTDVPELSPPGRGEVLVRMSAVALNYRDLLVARGHDRWRPPARRIPASDGVGVVTAIGPNVDRVRPGQRVLTTILPRWISGPLDASKREGALGGPGRDGVLAERVLLDAEAVVPVPDYLSDVEAATVPCAGLTAWHALTRAGSLRPDTTVLVQGTGGVALFALQLAIAAGARVIAISSATHKVERLRHLGASAVINYRDDPHWDAAVVRLTNGKGVDHVLDIGGAATIMRSISAVGFGGVVSLIGLVGGMHAELDIGAIFQKNLRLDGVETGSRTMLEDMLCFLDAHRIHPVIDTVFPFDATRDAFLRLDSHAHVGKVCIGF